MTKKKPQVLEFTDQVTKFGNGAHLIMPKESIGKKVKVRIEFI